MQCYSKNALSFFGQSKLQTSEIVLQAKMVYRKVSWTRCSAYQSFGAYGDWAIE